MISIGLAGWGDHDQLYVTGIRPKDKLAAYSRYFSVVEVDSSYYAIHKDSLFERWASETPAHFSFLVKAYQGMTGHNRQAYSEAEKSDLFRSFTESIQPLIAAGKLKAVLFQYPPWFDCTRANVAELRAAKERMDGIPVALEFRHESWFYGAMRDKTLGFMRDAGWIHSICDEPQVAPGSIPTVLQPTHEELTVVRFHGRNAAGWKSTDGARDWREVRYLYRYNEDELLEWKERLLKLEAGTREICVIFNNNSGGDAADNARQLMELLRMETREAPPRQMELFD
jgi:uncharacterized protein YecE (DUF72 family)